MRSNFPLMLLWATVVSSAAEGDHPTPAFPDPAGRRARLQQAFPEMERLASDWAKRRGVPGMSWGVVIDGETALVRTLGYRDWDAKLAVEPATTFRIASMTKSFTALAILKLRDEGKLSLEDDVSRWIPEIGRLRYPTSDTAPLRVRQLLTHGAGFPEDNPWGDQQLGRPDPMLTGWLNKGIPWSTPPDTAYEYSNYGFGLLGRIVTKASGRDYREYLEAEILKPLGMTASTLEPKEARGAATGYRPGSAGPGSYRVEPSLVHGAFGAMGGLVTNAPDLARYVAFHLSAFPPRDGDEPGPVRRASVREMQRLWRVSGLQTRRDQPDGPLQVRSTGYGYGLSVSRDCRFEHIVGHGGGLPGFGSYMLWLPEYGVGLFAMTNLTYAGPAGLLSDMMDTLRRTGGLTPRTLAPSRHLEAARQTLFSLWTDWKQAEAERVAADNLFLDRAAADRQADIAALKKVVGNQCRLDGPVRSENWLRGDFDLACEQGARVNMSFTLAPTPEPSVQYWVMTALRPPGAALRRAADRIAFGKLPGQLALDGLDRARWKVRLEAFARAYGDCKVGEAVGGDGVSETTLPLQCARGNAQLSLRADARGRITSLSLTKPASEACVP